MRLSAHHGKVWAKTDGRCWYCGIALIAKHIVPPPDHQFTVDHLVPRVPCEPRTQRNSLNGGLDNCVPACRLCNNRKGGLTLEEFRWFEDEGLRPTEVPFKVPPCECHHCKSDRVERQIKSAIAAGAPMPLPLKDAAPLRRLRHHRKQERPREARAVMTLPAPLEP